jgi:hypothetical protein
VHTILRLPSTHANTPPGAAIEISGGGTNKLKDFPDMYLGQIQIPGQINIGECSSTEGFAVEYPNPGAADKVTKSRVAKIGFKAPTGGKCFAPKSKGDGRRAGGNSSDPSAPVYSAPSGAYSSLMY